MENLDESGLVTPADGGLVTPSGLTSVPAGMETPDTIELRKKKIENEMDEYVADYSFSFTFRYSIVSMSS